MTKVVESGLTIKALKSIESTIREESREIHRLLEDISDSLKIMSGRASVEIIQAKEAHYEASEKYNLRVKYQFSDDEIDKSEKEMDEKMREYEQLLREFNEKNKKI